MPDDTPIDVPAAQDALALANQAGAPAAAAARRVVRRHMLALGLANSLAIVVSGLVAHWVDPDLRLLRALATGVAWGAVFGTVLTVATSGPVRAVPARRRVVLVVVASCLVVGASIGIGYDYPVAYVIGAAAAFAVWALGARWVSR